MFRITFRQETVKRLKEELEKAYVRGDKQAVRRLSVLIMIGKRMSLESILSLWNVSATKRLQLAERVCESSVGRVCGMKKHLDVQPRLTKTQKRKLAEWIEAGPEACGYDQRLLDAVS